MMHPCMSKLDARPQWGSTLRSTGRRYASASSMVSAPPPSRTVAKPRHRRSSDLSLLLPWKAGATHDAGDATGPQGGVVPSTEHSRHQKRMKKEPKPDDVVAWKLSNVKVRCADDNGKDDHSVTDAIVQAASKMLHAKKRLPLSAVTILRKAYDPRVGRKRQPGGMHNESSVDASEEHSETVPPHAGKFSYTLLVDHKHVLKADSKPKHIPNKTERVTRAELAQLMHGLNASILDTTSEPPSPPSIPPENHNKRDPIIIVGAGPAGLFAALSLASRGYFVKLLERGKAVEERGRDIGALVVRRKLNPESNFCFGEGGAGTWSDGKLTTKVGRNGAAVRAVLNTLVQFGASNSILSSGKPHLGTDKLVLILRRFRQKLLDLGAEIHFESRVDSILTHDGHACGVKLSSGEEIKGQKVIVAPGHSARGMYKHLIDIGAQVAPKPFSVGFRIEHPQDIIDSAQYGPAAPQQVDRGKGKIPVADYKLAANVSEKEVNQAVALSSFGNKDEPYEWLQGASETVTQQAQRADHEAQHTSQHAAQPRNVYSFCMCPGGQVVPTSVQEGELCVNGMSFSQRNSQWANSAVVVAVGESDWQPWVEDHGVLAGEALQRHIESRAACMSPETLCAPAQRVVDFLDETISETLPKTSYRLGVHSAPLHKLYPPQLTAALQQALQKFPRKIRDYLHQDAVLIGAETRTSAPVRIARDDVTLEAVGLPGLLPCGEGAGYAGGIVSAAVEGIRVAAALSGDEELLELVDGGSARTVSASSASY